MSNDTSAKTLLTNIRTVLTTNRDTGGALSYMPPQSIQMVAPRGIPPLRRDQYPFIGIAPIRAPERWVTTAKRQADYVVELVCLHYYTLQETAVENAYKFVDDVCGVVRNNLFDSYIDKPAQINITSFHSLEYSDGFYLIVATVELECSRTFLSS